MTVNPYAIRVSSEKGGVGKTVVAINLAVLLSMLKYRVLLVDADFSNPSIGLYLGMEDVSIGIKDVMSGTSKFETTISRFSPTGLHLLLGTLAGGKFSPTDEEVDRVGRAATDYGYDFIILDTSPGMGATGAFMYYGEVLLVTTPQISALTSVLRLAKAYDNHKLKHNLVINRFKNKGYEISLDEIERIYERKVLTALPEDEIVPTSIGAHIPAYLLDRKNPFSLRIYELAKAFTPIITQGTLKISNRRGIFAFIKRILGLNRM